MLTSEKQSEKFRTQNLCYDEDMNSLNDYKKELDKCSKCGQCQNACPVYKITRNDCAVSRGKFIMLHGVAVGDLKMSKNINKYLDMCLKCGKCNDFCPAGIDAVQIINCAKYEYSKGKFSGAIINFLQSRLIFSSFVKLGKILSRPFRKRFQNKKNTLKVMYFKGCVNEVFPQNGNYLYKIFNNSDIEIITPDFDCCGLPFLSEGNFKRFKQAYGKNIKYLQSDYDYLVTDCASCEDTLLSYNKYFNSKINPQNTLNWGDIIASKNLRFDFKKPVKVTFHKPCHLKNDDFFEKIISRCKNVEYVKCEDYDNCCGLAGSFTLKNRDLSKEISKQKALNIQNTNADYVITSCPACILGLKQGLMLIKNKKVKVVSLLEFLAKADVIKG